MKLSRSVLPMFLLGAIALTNCSKPTGSLDESLARFVTAKSLQTYALAQTSGAKIPTTVDELFAAILADDSTAAAKLFHRLEAVRNAPPPPWEAAGDWLASQLGTPRIVKNPWHEAVWEPIREAYWMYFLSRDWESTRLQGIVREITGVIGTNSIYFGGTDVGRFAITAAMEAHEQGRPSFVLTQNLLCDGSYRDYVNAMFGSQLRLPTATDFVEIYNEYAGDAKRRQQAGMLGRNEHVAIDGNGVVRVSGPGAYWELTGRLVKAIANKNQDRVIYIEQSEPLYGLSRYLVPAGPIFRLSRTPFDSLPDETIQADRAYWAKLCHTLLGGWITEKTTFTELCDFVGRVYGRGETAEFSGDTSYLRERVAQAYVSKLRLNIAGLYVWRCVNATDLGEKTRMWSEALFAMKQALALAPGSFDTATYIKNVLVDVKQYENAIAVIGVCLALNPDDKHLLSERERITRLALRNSP